MTTQPNIVRLPTDAKARRERQLAAAWADEDRLARLQREARAKAAKLEREVSRDRGYPFPQRREVLERPVRRQERTEKR